MELDVKVKERAPKCSNYNQTGESAKILVILGKPTIALLLELHKAQIVST